MPNRQIIYLLQGDPNAFYQSIIAKIPAYDIPEVQCEMKPLEGGPGIGDSIKGAFSKLTGKTAPPAPPTGHQALVIHDSTNKVTVTAYQYGNNFYIGTQHEWYSEKVGKIQNEAIENGWRTWRSEITQACFDQVVGHIVNECIREYAEQTAEEEGRLDPRQAFTIGS